MQSSLVLGGLNVASTGRLDIADNEVFLKYSAADPIGSITAWIHSGYNAGAWTGVGILSTTAQTTGASYGIGYADSADSGNPAGLSAGTIEIKYTLLGDANLNGVVDGTDLGIVAANFNKGVSAWDQGDFNYDNIVDGTDFGDLAANFNKGISLAAVLTPVAQVESSTTGDPLPGLLTDRKHRGTEFLGAVGRQKSLPPPR